VHAVDGVSFSVLRGETFGLVGESGCGKSTLARVILRLIEPEEGSILFEGRDMRSLAGRRLREQRAQMRMVFQKPFDSLDPRQSVLDIIADPFRVHKVRPDGGLEHEVLRLMDLVGLSKEYLHRFPHEFSGGQRQRIGIARAIAMNPKLIVCDEPVSALDVSIQAQILNLLKDLQAQFGLTYVFISHNLSVVKFMSNRIAVMYLGQIVELAAAETLYTEPLHPYTRALLSAMPTTDMKPRTGRILIEGEVPSPIDPPVGCRFHTRCGSAMEICAKKAPSLVRLAEGHSVACHLAHAQGERS
jgi:oligopeptide/dipeptide ABC transporter ATP-binding protein